MSEAVLNFNGETFDQAFTNAEKVLKRFERIAGKTLESAINQLRYACRHHLDALAADDSDSRTDALKCAIAHCHRAQYDAVDAAIAIVGKNIVAYNEKYLQSSLIGIIPMYADYFARAILLLRKLSEEGAPRDIGVGDLGEFGKCLDELIEIWTDLSAKRPLVEKLDYEKRVAEKISTRRHVMNALLTILGIAVAVAFGVIAKWF